MPRTAFKADQHGFAFVNAWKFDPDESERMRQSLVQSSAQATKAVPNSVRGVFGRALNERISEWLDAALPDYYGLCGGMAFTAADFFYAGRPLPRGRDYSDTPNSDDPADKAMRDYLWRRQMESLGPNAPKLLAWMLMLHSGLPFTGPGWLLGRTRQELATLRGHIERNEPWPICLIGASPSPFNNHQVLAIGYESAGPDQATVYVYDMNGPGQEHTIRLRLGGEQLEAEESCPNHERGPLRGLFCETYSPAPPPDLPERG